MDHLFGFGFGFGWGSRQQRLLLLYITIHIYFYIRLTWLPLSIPILYTIFQGIVNAIRKLGGRFLVLDEETEIYKDIGDKKATEKTSQALREGQAQIRNDVSEEESNGNGKSPLRPPPIQMNAKAGKEMTSEDYFQNSLKVLKSLYHVENNMTREMALRPAPTSVATQLELQSAVSSAHMAAALDLDKSDGMVPVQQQEQTRQLELETLVSPKAPPLMSKMPPRARSRTDSPDRRQNDSLSTLSISTWSLSSSRMRMRDANSCASASGMSFLSLSDTFSTEASNGANSTGTGTGTGGDREFWAEEGMELMPPIELEFEAGLMDIPVMNIGDAMRGREQSCDSRFTEAEAMDMFNDNDGNSFIW